MPSSPETVTYSGWCLPTIIYLVLAGIGMVMNAIQIGKCQSKELTANGRRICSKTTASWTSLVLSLIVTVLYASLLYYLCANGHWGWAWFALVAKIVLLPILTVVIGITLIMSSLPQRPDVLGHSAHHQRRPQRQAQR